MKIKITAENRHLTFHVPLSYWLIKPILKIALRNDEKESIRSILPYLQDGLFIIKEYRKEYGHFVLLDIIASSGEKIKIII